MPKTLLLWTPNLPCLSSDLLRDLFRDRLEMVDRLILVIRSNDKDGSFGPIYQLVHEAYERLLQAMTVDNGLRIGLNVLVFPQHCRLEAFRLQPESTDFIVIGDSSPNLGLPISQRISPAPRPSVRATRPPSFEHLSIASFDVVALGGTFDHLHSGHKIMLASAILLAGQRVVIGLTDESMLENKKHRERLLDYKTRLQTLRQFVEAFAGPASSLEIDVVRLTDPYGPTISTPLIDLLVVSEETLPGANEINRIRGEKGMHGLEIVAVQFVRLSDTQRISSTLIREHDG